jgi:hypothetical protein
MIVGLITAHSCPVKFMKTSRMMVPSVWIPSLILFLCALTLCGAGGAGSGLPNRALGIVPAVSTGVPTTLGQGGWSARDTVKTNTFERIITNVVQVWVPTNQFVYECRTNWIHSYTTNVIDVFQTDWIDQFRTNVVTLRRTNWIDAYTTNPVTVYRTNPVTVYLTNQATVWQTNWQTLNLTNWETVVLFKTNWLKQFFTNTVELEGTTNRAVTEQNPDIKPVPGHLVLESRPAGTKDVLVLEASRSTPTSPGELTGVKLRVSLAGEPASPLRVDRWVVEREDRPMVFSAQDRDFTRELSPGKYKVAVEARRDANHPPIYARAKLDVTPEAVTLQK